jgi:hypothetical protein
VSERSFRSSNFKAQYNSGTKVPNIFQIGAAVTLLLKAFFKLQNLDWDRGGGAEFFDKLQEEALQNGTELLKDIPTAVTRMWTSALAVNVHERRMEFCGIMCQAFREDLPELVQPAADLALAINQLCVAGNLSASPTESGILQRVLATHPPDNVCYRGGGFDNRYREFFVPGRQFRQPAYLATSFSRAVCEDFIARATSPVRILWLIRIDPVHKCRHVNLVKKSNVPGEEVSGVGPSALSRWRRPGCAHAIRYLFLAVTPLPRHQLTSWVDKLRHAIQVLAAKLTPC